MHPIDLEMDGIAIEEVSAFKYLGITLDNKLRYQEHVNSVIKRTNKLRGIIYSNKYLLPITMCKKLIIALALPVITYCDSIYGNASGTVLQTLDVAYRNLLKTAFRLAHDFSTNRVYHSTGFLPLLIIRQVNRAKLALRSLIGRCAPYFTNIITPVDPEQRRRPPREVAQVIPKYVVPPCRIEVKAQAVQHWAPVILNHLPDALLTGGLLSNSVDPVKTFGKKYKKHVEQKFKLVQDWSRENEQQPEILF